jgi:phenylacetate-CoA ligase
LKEKIYKYSPNFFQNILISMFNYLAYSKRYGARYSFYRQLFKQNRTLSIEELQDIQKIKFQKLVKHAFDKSPFYRDIYKSIDKVEGIEQISLLPIISKETIRENIKSIRTTPLKKNQVFETGGTTGVSLQVVYTEENLQERFALLDTFRSEYGYKLGMKTAWFSGKRIINQRDVKNNRFWKTDQLYHIRYYSTFHLKKEYLKYYLENLIKYKPQFLIGYPNSMFELAKYGLENGYSFPENTVKAIFPTAESFSLESKKTLELFFNTKAYNQYASSEGAPFIIQCRSGNLHMELQSGVFEVLNSDDRPAKMGRLVVTSFTSYGTPLIRYDIGDGIELMDGKCTCENNNPMISHILGRTNDFIYSNEMGKVHQVRIADTVKKVQGVKNFQVIQDSLTEITIFIVIDSLLFTKEMKVIFFENWRDRVGDKIKLNVIETDHIAAASSGKYQMVINNIKHLL